MGKKLDLASDKKFVPKLGETYFYRGYVTKMKVRAKWKGDSFDCYNMSMNNVFRTEGEVK